MRIILETEHLYLRPCNPLDAEIFLAHWQRPEVRRYLWDDKLAEIDQVMQFIQDSANAFKQKRCGMWHAIYKPTEQFCGVCQLNYKTPETPELLYSLEPDYWGLGLATDMGWISVSYAFETLGADKVVASVDEPNTRSIWVLERLGFQFVRKYPGPADNLLLDYAVSKAGFQAALDRRPGYE